MKKVLIIAYYWPPQGGSGVQRWLKFVRYLRCYDIEPVIYTPLNPEQMTTDETLLRDIPPGVEVIRRKIFEPYGIYKILTGKRGKTIKPGFISAQQSLKEKISLFIRSNFFFPDPKCFWIRPSVRFLEKYLNRCAKEGNSFDSIISTGPPHSMHLIGMKVSARTGIPWIADFRDPWTGMFNFREMGYGKSVVKRHMRYEREVVSRADAVIVVGRGMKRYFETLHPRRIEVITNGFDKADFSGEVPLQDRFLITYTGLFLKMQNPEVLWNALSALINEVPDFADKLQIRFVGNTDPSVLQSVTAAGLGHYLILQDYTPHDEVVRIQREASVLLLAAGDSMEAKGILTGKFFEYLAAGKPILAFGPENSDMGDILGKASAGRMFGYGAENEGSLKEYLRMLFESRGGAGSLDLPRDEKYIAGFSREHLTERLAQLIETVVKK